MFQSCLRRLAPLFLPDLSLLRNKVSSKLNEASRLVQLCAGEVSDIGDTVDERNPAPVGN